MIKRAVLEHDCDNVLDLPEPLHSGIRWGLDCLGWCLRNACRRNLDAFAPLRRKQMRNPSEESSVSIHGDVIHLRLDSVDSFLGYRLRG
jgi:hypothetical protein